MSEYIANCSEKNREVREDLGKVTRIELMALTLKTVTGSRETMQKQTIGVPEVRNLKIRKGTNYVTET